MSTTSAIDKLRQDQKRIEELLKELETKKKEVDKEYASAFEEENKILEELRQSRDQYQYSRLDMKLHVVSRRRKQIEPQKQAIERKIRGHQEELEKIKARIGYITPKGERITHKEV